MDGGIIFPKSCQFPFQFGDDRQCNKEGNHYTGSKKQEAVVATEGKDEGVGDEAEENVGKEVD